MKGTEGRKRSHAYRAAGGEDNGESKGGGPVPFHWMGEDELWLKVYEYGLRKRIKPRDSLREEYEERKN